MPVSAPDAAIIRSEYQAVDNLFVNIPPLTVFATATVSATPTWPTAQLSVSGASADWLNMRNQMIVKVTKPDGSLAFEGTVRKTDGLTTSLIFIANIREGDSGVALERAPSIESGDTVTVYAQIVPFAYFSRIDSDVFYKRYDVPWDNGDPNSSQLTKNPAAVVNMGSHRHLRVNPGDSAQWEMSGAASFSWFGNDVNFLWQLPTGVTNVGFTTNTDPAVRLGADPGIYIIRLRGEDDGTGRRDTNFRYVFVTDGDTVKAFSEDFTVVGIEGDRNPQLGRSLTLTIKASRDTDVMSRLYKSAPVLITYEHTYSGDQWQTVEETPTEIIENFFGYVRRYERVSTTPEGVDTYTVLVESPLIYFGSLPVAAQTILAKIEAEVDAWEKVLDTLCHVAYFVYYILNFHAGALLSLSDFFPGDLTAFQRPALSSGAGDMLSAVRKIVGELVTGGNIGCTSNGAIYLMRNPVYEADLHRNDLDEFWTWTGDDVVGELEYNRDPIPEASETEGTGSVTGTTTPLTVFTARANLFAGGQGVGKDTMPSFIGLSENDIRDRVGHWHQATNRPTKSLIFEVRGGHDFTDPARMLWHILDLATYDPADAANQGLLDNKRWIPLEVGRTWQVTPFGIRKRLNVTFQPETKGKRAPLKPDPVIGAPISPTPAGCSACATTSVITYGYDYSGWTGTIFFYGGPNSSNARTAYNDITLTLPTSVCVKSITLPIANQTGWAWANANLTIDGVDQGQQTSGGPSQTGGCEDTSPTPLTWTFVAPIRGRVFFFEGLGVTGSGNPASSVAVFCAKLEICD